MTTSRVLSPAATTSVRPAVHDTVRWRVVNASIENHPMHMHGFFYDVLSKGFNIDSDVRLPGTAHGGEGQRDVHMAGLVIGIEVQPGQSDLISRGEARMEIGEKAVPLVTIAKDGLDLPEHQRREIEVSPTMGVGEVRTLGRMDPEAGGAGVLW